MQFQERLPHISSAIRQWRAGKNIIPAGLPCYLLQVLTLGNTALVRLGKVETVFGKVEQIAFD